MLLGRAEGIVTLDISDLTAKVGMATSQLGALDRAGSRDFDTLDRQLQSVGMSTDRLGTGFVALGAAMLAPMTLGVAHAIDLEHQLKGVQIALGDVSDHDFGKLAEQINQIGMDGAFSATEIAIMSEELAKAGFTIDDIMSGDPAAGFGNMAQAVSDLATATGDGLGPATEAVVVAMSTWKPEIVGVENALTDANRAADIFTIAANESMASVSDITSGMRNFGPTAALMGVGFDEAAASIAVFTNYGLKAREAGTSLTRALTMLADPTSEASTLMADLGIAAFDLEGNFVGLPSLMSQLEDKMGGMSQQQKLAALSTIFGAEAMDVMGLAVLGAGDDVEALMGIMSGDDESYVSAADQAAARTDTLRGSIDRLVEGLNTFLGMLAHGLLPPLRFLADGLDAVIGALSRIPTPILEAAGMVITGLGLMSTAIGGFLLLGPRIVRFMATARLMSQLPGILGAGATAFVRMTSILRFAMLALTGAGVVIAAFAVAAKFNLLGIGDAVRQFIDSWNAIGSLTTNPISRFLSAFGAALTRIDIGFIQQLAEVLFDLSDAFTAFFEGFNLGTGGSTEKAIKDFEGFATELEDGSWIIEKAVGDYEKGIAPLGEIIDSWENEDGTVTVRIRTEGGEELETTINMADGFVSDTYEAEVTVKAENVPSTLERIENGLERVRSFAREMNMPWLATIADAGVGTIQRLQDIGNAFSRLRDKGIEPVEAGLRALAIAFPGLTGVIGPLQDAWDRIKTTLGEVAATALDLGRRGLRTLGRAASRAWDALGDGISTGLDLIDTYGRLRDRGLDPVDAGLRTLANRFPALRDVLNPMIRGWDTLTDTFQRFRSVGMGPLEAGWRTLTATLGSLDLSGIVSSLREALSGLLDDVASWLPDIGALSDAIGNWVADLFDDEDLLGVGGFGFTEAMADRLETETMGAWERAWSNFRSWATGRVETVTGWVLDVGIPTLRSAVTNVWDWIKEQIMPGGAAGSEISVGDITVHIGQLIKGWSIDLWNWIKAQLGVYGGGRTGASGSTGAAVVGAGHQIDLGDLTVRIAGWIINEIEDLHGKVDAHIETALGEGFVFVVDITLDYAFAFTGDPGGVAKATLLAILGAALAMLFVTGGVTSVLALAGVIGIAALGYYVVRQVMDYFDRNPAELERLKVRVGELWADLKESEIGWFFTGLERLAGIVTAAVEKLIHLREIIMGLPGPLGDAARAAEKLFLALTALSAIALIGGAGGRVNGRGRNIGWLEGLGRGLWKIAKFPFELIINPVKAIKNLLDIGGRGSRGGRGKLGFFELLRGFLKFPFHVISLGVRSIGENFKLIGRTAGYVKKQWDAFWTGYNRSLRDATKPLRGLNEWLRKSGLTASTLTYPDNFVGPRINELTDRTGKRFAAFSRGLRGMWNSMIAGKGPIRAMLRGITSLGDLMDEPVERFNRGMRRYLRAVGRGYLQIPVIRNIFGMAQLFVKEGLARLVDELRIGGARFRANMGFLIDDVAKTLRRLGPSMADEFRTAATFVADGIDRLLAIAGRAVSALRVLFSPRNWRFLGDNLATVGRTLFGPLISAVRSGGANVIRMMATAFRLIALWLDNVLVPINERVRGFFARLFGPRNIGIVADPKAFRAFSALADSIDDIARRAGRLRQVGRFFGELDEVIGRGVRPLSSLGRFFSGLADDAGRLLPRLGSMGDVFARMFTVVSRFSPVLRAIGTAFAFFGIERGIAKLWDVIGGMDGIRSAWDQVKAAFDAGGLRGVLELAFTAILDGIRNLASSIRESLSNLSMGDIWNWIAESARNIDWWTVGELIIIGLSLLVAGIPGILLGLVGVFFWDWIRDSLAGYTWGEIGQMLVDGIASAAQAAWNWLNGPFEAFLRGPAARAIRNLWNGIDWGAVGTFLLSGLVTAAQATWDWLNGPFETWLRGPAAQAIRNLWNEIDWGAVGTAILLGMVTAAQAVWDWLNGPFESWLRGPAAQALRDMWNNIDWGAIGTTILVGIVSAAQAVWDWLNTSFEPWLRNAVSGAWDWLKEKGQELIESVVDGFNLGITMVSAWLGLLPGMVQAFVAGTWDWLMAKGEELMTSLVSGLTNGWGAVRDWIMGIDDSILGLLAGIGDILLGLGEDIIGNFKSGLAKGWAGVTGWFTDRINELIGLFNGLIEAFNNLPGPDLGFIDEIGKDADAATKSVKGLTSAIAGLKSGNILANILPSGKEVDVPTSDQGGPGGVENLPPGTEMAEPVGWSGGGIAAMIKQQMTAANAEIVNGTAQWQRSMDIGSRQVPIAATTQFGMVPTGASTELGRVNPVIRSQTSGWAASVSATGGGLGASASAAFGTVAPAAGTELAKVNSEVTSQSAGWAAGMSLQGAVLQMQAYETFANVTTGARTALTETNGEIAIAIASWATTLTAHGPSLQSVGQTLGQSAGSGVVAGMNSRDGVIGNAARGWATPIRNALSTLQDAGRDIGQAAGSGTVQGINNRDGVVGDAARGYADVIRFQTDALRQAGVTIGRAAGSGAAAGIGEMRGSVSSATSGYTTAVSGYAGAMRVAGLVLGRGAGAGVVDGLNSMLGSVRAAAANIVNTVMATMAVVAMLGSPSRITTQFGRWIGKGLEIGIEASVDPVVNAATRLADAAVGAFADVGDRIAPLLTAGIGRGDFLGREFYDSLTGPGRFSRSGHWNTTSGTSEEHMQVLMEHFKNMLFDGEWAGDALAHLPRDLADAAMAFGRVWAPHFERYNQMVSRSTAALAQNHGTASGATTITYHREVRFEENAIVVNEATDATQTAQLVREGVVEVLTVLENGFDATR